MKKKEEELVIQRIDALKLEEGEVLFVKVPESKLQGNYVAYIENVLSTVIDIKRNPIYRDCRIIICE